MVLRAHKYYSGWFFFGMGAHQKEFNKDLIHEYNLKEEDIVSRELERERLQIEHRHEDIRQHASL